MIYEEITNAPCTNENCSPTKLNAFDDETHFEILRDTLQQIDLLYRVVDKYSKHMEIVHKADDIMRIFKDGKCASLIGVEGLHQIGNSSSVLRMYHKLGVRYITLAHNKNNPYADSAVSCREDEFVLDETLANIAPCRPHPARHTTAYLIKERPWFRR